LNEKHIKELQHAELTHEYHKRQADGKKERKHRKEFTFSAMIRSPTWKVGYMDLEGMNLSSAINHLKAVASMYEGSMALVPMARLILSVLDLRDTECEDGKGFHFDSPRTMVSSPSSEACDPNPIPRAPLL
jgi:hypothetical protein